MKQFTLSQFVRNIIESKDKLDFPVKVKLPTKLSLDGIISSTIITVNGISIAGILQPKYNAEYCFGSNDEVLVINVYINLPNFKYLPNFKCGLIRDLYIGSFGLYKFDNIMYIY